MGAAFLDPRFFAAAWIGPFLLALAVRRATVAHAYGLGFLFGLVLTMTAAPWVFDTIEGYGAAGRLGAFCVAAAGWALLAQVPALALAGAAFASRHGPAPGPVAFALFLAAAFAAAPPVVSFHLALTQTGLPILLQGLDLTGPAGFDVLLLFCAAAAAERASGARAIRLELPAVTLLLAWLAYGAAASATWSARGDAAPRLTIGIVQPNEPPGATGAVPAGFMRTYPPMMAATDVLAGAGADLVVWPEGTATRYLDDRAVAESFGRRAAALGTALLFQDTGRDVGVPGAVRNAAILLGPDGEEAGRHDKTKLFPVRETLGIADASPALRRLARKVLPTADRVTLPGDVIDAFALTLGDQKASVVPLVCFETMYPAQIAGAGAEGRRPRLIVGLIYDGWFGRTAQPWQHGRTAALRAIENRASVVYAINNGPSVVYRPDGRRAYAAPIDEAGGFLAPVPLAEAGPTLYARAPRAVPMALVIGALTCLVLGLRGALSARRGRPAAHRS